MLLYICMNFAEWLNQRERDLMHGTDIKRVFEKPLATINHELEQPGSFADALKNVESKKKALEELAAFIQAERKRQRR